MSNQLFEPSLVLGIPKRTSKKGGNMREAVKTESNERPKVEEKVTITPPLIVEEVVIPAVILDVETKPNLDIPDIKKQILTKEKGKTRTSYIIDKKIVNYIDNISRELKYAEIQNYHQGIIAEEFLRIGQYLYEKYKHKLSETITSGDQVSEFVFREFRKEFDIIDDE